MRILLALTIMLALPGMTTGLAQHWPHWRGPTHDGVSAEKNLPVEWSAVVRRHPPTTADAPA